MPSAPVRPVLLVGTLSLAVTTLSAAAELVVPILGTIGQQLDVGASALTVALIAGNLDPATGLPAASAYRLVALLGVGSCVVIGGAALIGLVADRGRGAPRETVEPTDVEVACAGAGEWSPVSGIR